MISFKSGKFSQGGVFMNRLAKNIFSISVCACLLVLFAPANGHAHYDYKLIPGMPFVYFELEDLNRQRWVSTYLRGKPVIILTGHRYQRYEILKWAENLKRDFWATGLAHLVWVVNLSKFPFSTSRQTIRDEWMRFGPPIPLLLDWHGVIGKALRVNYGIPNIIVLDSAGRFAFHEMHTFSPGAYASIVDRINAVVGASYGGMKPAIPTPNDGSFKDAKYNTPTSIPPTGKKGDSD